MTDQKINFTHLWVDDFGWENTIFLPDDFESVEEFAKNELDNFVVFCAIQENGKVRILKGNYFKL